jgi:hypothetical protein
MTKKRFRYNPQTLSFEPIQNSFLKKLAKVTFQFVLSLIVAVIVFFSYTYFYDTPKAKSLRRSNEELALKFELLGRMVDESDRLLVDMQQRDNMIYRSIFEADTIPTALRMGGFGGVARYNHLAGSAYSDLLIDLATKLDQVTWKTYIQSKSFDEVIDLAKNKEKMIHSIPAIQPVSVGDLRRISADYGFRPDPFTRQRQFHHGIDFVGPIGTPIYATGNGRVVVAEYSFFGYGRTVVVDHGFGYRTLYAHLNTINVRVGDEVVRGQRIATLGNTGRSTGPHLHYEVIHRNKPVNPINYFNDMQPEEYEAMVRNVRMMEQMD